VPAFGLQAAAFYEFFSASWHTFTVPTFGVVAFTGVRAWVRENACPTAAPQMAAGCPVRGTVDGRDG